MKTILKMSLVALAVASTAANAAITIANQTVSTPAKVSAEGIKSATGTKRYITLGTDADTTRTSLNNVVVTIGTGTEVDGLIRVTFSAPVAAVAGTFVNSFTNLPALSLTGAGQANEGLVLAVANTEANSVTYRVVRESGAATKLADNTTLTFSTLRFVAADIIAANGLSMTVSTETKLGAVSEAAKTEKLYDLVTQFALSIPSSGLTKQIDVAKSRTAFVGDDQFVEVEFEKKTETANVINPFKVAYKKQTYTLTGDFSFLKDEDAKEDDIQVPADALKLASGCDFDSIKATAVKFTCADETEPSVRIDLDKNTAGTPDPKTATVLKETKFTLTGEYDYSNPAGRASNIVSAFTNTSLGNWTLNGSVVQIPYMVYGNVGGKDYNQVIQLTNNSNIEGAIYVDIYDGEGKALALNKKLNVTAKKNSVTNIASDIRAIITEAKYAGKVSIRVVAEVPSDTAQVYAAYQDVATSERAIVVGLKK